MPYLDKQGLSRLWGHVITHVDDIVEPIEESLDTKTIKGTKITNSDVAYVKDIPENSAGYAKISKIGGMTRKSVNLLKPIADTLTTGGYTVSTNDDGTIQITGAATTTSEIIITLNANSVYLPANEAYSYSVLKDGVAPRPAVGCKVVYTDDAGGQVWSWGEQDTTRPRRVAQIYLQFKPEIGDTLVCGTYSIMLNEGSTALPYEPYFDGLRNAPVTEVESVGENLFGGEAIIKKIASLPGVSTSVNTTNKTVWFNADQINNKVLFDKFKPNTQYTLIFKGYNTNTSAQAVNLLVEYTDGSSHQLMFDASTQTVKFVSAGNKSIKHIVGMYYTQTTYLYYDECGIFEGVVSYENFTPYVHQALPIPESVRNLDGYGWGINENCYNYIDFEKKQFVKRVEKVDLGTLGWSYNDDNAWWYSSVLRSVMVINYNAPPLLAENCTTTAWADKAIGTINQDGSGNLIVLSNDSATKPSGWLYYELATPVITDISDLLTIGNVLPVEAGSTVTMVNEYDHDVPSTIDFYENINEIVGAKTFVGDLVGTADRAIADENGNRIDVTAYAPAGFGLGEENAPLITSEEELNSTVKSGFYRIFISGKVWGNTGITANGGSMIISGVIAERTNQIVFIQNTNYVVKRYMYGGAWSEWVDCSPSAFAPAGYGLGETEPKKLTTPDEAIVPGFYQIAYDGYTGDGTLNDWRIGWSSLLVEKKGTTVIQSAKYSDIEWKRYKTAEGWSPWEWVNPPMGVGTEYRTTERIDGKAVYKKKLDSGVIQYRLDGETKWNDYYRIYNAAPTGYIETALNVSINDDLYPTLNAAYENTDIGKIKFLRLTCDNRVTKLPSGTWFVTIKRSNTNYGFMVLEKESATGSYIAYRSRYGATWTDFEWINPPMAVSTEYRTTERMDGKAVYKKKLENGIIQYRLDGETTWNDYNAVYNAAPAYSYGINDLTAGNSGLATGKLYLVYE